MSRKQSVRRKRSRGGVGGPGRSAAEIAADDAAAAAALRLADQRSAPGGDDPTTLESRKKALAADEADRLRLVRVAAKNDQAAAYASAAPAAGITRQKGDE